MKKSLAFVCLMVAFIALTVVAQDKPNFSGTWVMDAAKSDPMGGGRGGPGGGPGGPPGGGPGGGGPVEITLVIKHEGINLNISQKMNFGGQERVSEQKYTTDGAENSNPGMGGQSVPSKSRWDGNKLITESTVTRSTPNGEMTLNTTITRSLSDDGKVMTLETVTKGGPRGDMTRKQVFNKQ